MSVLIKLKDIGKKFGNVEALSNVNLEISRGEVVGLVGGNGAGKTTLLRIISGVYSPSEGSIQFEEGVNGTAFRLGVVPESTGLYYRLTAWENIRYHTRIHGVNDDIAWERTAHLAKLLNHEDALGRHTRGFSKGMRQKTAIIRALAHGPDALLLDEPTSGLDVTSARSVRKLVQQLRDEGGTVVYSTHRLEEARQVCDRIVIVHNGSIRADSTPSELMNETSSETLEEAYVHLTRDKSRARQEQKESEGKLSKWWRRFLTGKTPEVFEDE
ncbi:MAG: hypothetical protein CMA84_06580 [Euryarchaeota archaeon]|nr:hypothetical protein [Euryarchaeota archaeon]|tara:strand:- start:226 stop:1038 length:813 start_codon:yes stop_codon:yes gene_type:complete